MMELCCILHILMIVFTISTIAVRPTNSSGTAVDDWAFKNLNDPNSVPQPKLVALFNRAANAYVRIRNKTVDATTTNIFDRDIILKIDMYGPTLLAIRSNRTGKYICHDDKSGNVVVKDNRDNGCLYISVLKNGYHVYRSFLKKKPWWHLGFQGKGNKKGKPRPGSRTSRQSQRFLEESLKALLKRRKG